MLHKSSPTRRKVLRNWQRTVLNGLAGSISLAIASIPWDKKIEIRGLTLFFFSLQFFCETPTRLSHVCTDAFESTVKCMEGLAIIEATCVNMASTDATLSMSALARPHGRAVVHRTKFVEFSQFHNLSNMRSSTCKTCTRNIKSKTSIVRAPCLPSFGGTGK